MNVWPQPLKLVIPSLYVYRNNTNLVQIVGWNVHMLIVDSNKVCHGSDPSITLDTLLCDSTPLLSLLAHCRFKQGI